MEYKAVYEGEKAKELIFQSIQDEIDIEKISIINTKTKLIHDDIAKGISIVLSVAILSIALKTGPVQVLGSLRAYCCGLVLVIFLYLSIIYLQVCQQHFQDIPLHPSYY